MKYTKIIAISALLIFSAGCSKTENSNTESLSNTTRNITMTNIPTSEPTETPTPMPLIDKDVDIVIGMISMDSEMTIEQYVENLKADEPEVDFSVYDSNHYSMKIKESERVELLNNLLSDDGENEFFGQLYEQYPGVYLKTELNDKCTEIIFHVDKAKYDECDFGVAFTPIFMSGIYCEYVQAYSLVPVEERDCIVKIINDETNEVIYSSEETE